MDYFNFHNIRGYQWLNVSLLAVDAETAIKKFNAMWGEGAKYTMTRGEPLKAMQVIS